MAFAYKMTCTVTSNSSLLPGTQTDYPLLVHVTDPLLAAVGSGGQIVNTDLNGPCDLMFFSNTDLSTGQLKWEIDYWNSTTGELIAWVKIPSLALGTVFYAGIGDASVSTFQGDSTNVWDSNFKAVHHGSDLANAAISLDDSTANNFNGTQGAGSLTLTTGKISGAMNAAGFNESAFVSGSSSIVTGNALTASGWIACSDAQGGAAIFGVGDSVGHDWMIYVSGGGNFFVFAVANTSENVNTGVAFSSSFQHVALVYDGPNTELRAYVNGSLAGTPASLSGSLVNSGSARLGWSDYLLGAEPVIGKLDETRVSASVRSANWIKIDYESQNDPATFVTKSFAVVGGGGGGPAGPALRNVNITTLRYRR